jgi:uncharacterized protein YndB with AHSA1/START domain
MAQTVQNSVFIERSVDDVFAFVTDPATTPQWQANLVRSEIVTPGPMGAGMQVLEVRRLGKSEQQALWEVTEYEPPLKRAYAYPKGFGPIKQKGVTIFEAKDGGTLLHFTAWVKASFPLSLLLPFLTRLMRRQNDRSFAALKQVLEHGVDSKAMLQDKSV